MKTSATIVVCCAVLMSVPTFADESVVHDLQVDGTIPTRCSMSRPTAADTNNSAFSVQDAGGALMLTSPIDQGALTNSATASFRFAITCTGAHDLIIASNGGLVNQTTPLSANGFLTRADYTLVASWGATTQSLTTDGSRATLDLSQTVARAGTLSVVFSLPSGRGPMTAGTYTDQIYIQLSAR
jgi:hypothetical protein